MADMDEVEKQLTRAIKKLPPDMTTALLTLADKYEKNSSQFMSIIQDLMPTISVVAMELMTGTLDKDALQKAVERALKSGTGPALKAVP